MNKYKILSNKIKTMLDGFYFNDDYEDFPYVDLDKTDKNILENRYFKIDSFPKCMEIQSPHSILDVFWDLSEDKNKYLIQENKFLRALLLIISYSKDMIIESGYFESDIKDYIKDILDKEEHQYLETITDTLFDFKEIKCDYYLINSLMKLALREKTQLYIYMIDLGLALEISGLFSGVYLGVNGKIDMVKYICNIEGLYIR